MVLFSTILLVCVCLTGGEDQRCKLNSRRPPSNISSRGWTHKTKFNVGENLWPGTAGKN